MTLTALAMACVPAGPVAAASAQDPVAATTQTVAGVASAAEQQVPVAGVVRDVAEKTDAAVRKPVEEIPNQAGAALQQTQRAVPTAAPAQPAVAAPAAPVQEAPPAVGRAKPNPAAPARAVTAARGPVHGGGPRAGAAERRQSSRAIDAAVVTRRELAASPDTATADVRAGAARAGEPASEQPGPAPAPDDGHGVSAVSAAAGTGAAFAGAAVLAALFLLLRPARRGFRLNPPSPSWGSAVVLLSIERPG